MSSHSGPHPGATRSTRYFPVSAFPTFESSDLALSFTALSSHPRYREALKPFDQGHLDRYKKSAELLQRWESIAERYTAIDPEEDTEIDVVTGDTLYKGEKIDLDDDETLEQWADDPLDDEDEEDEMVDNSRICQAGDSVLDKLKGSAFQDSEGDRDVLDFWGAESEMQIQVGELPDISCLPVRDVSAKDQADLDAFLRDEEERKRQEELDSDGLGPGAYSDDHVENAIDDDREDVIVCSTPIGRSARPTIVVSHPDESPRKKRRVGRPRKIWAARDDICQALDHTASLDVISAAPSSDDVNLCSEALGAGGEPFRTPKRSRGSGTRARRGRRPNITPLTPHLVGGVTRETKAEALTSEWMDRNLLRSEITTPYISRSSRVVKVPERLGEHVEWARIRRPYGKRSSPPIRKASPVHKECYVDLPPLPADWFDDNAISIATEKEVTTEDAVMAISSPQSVARETELEIPLMEREYRVDVAEDDIELEPSSISEDSEVLLPESVIDVAQSPLIYESAQVETVYDGSVAEYHDILQNSDADILNAVYEREFLESLLAMGTTYTGEREASVELEALRFSTSPSPSVLASSAQADDERPVDPSPSSPSTSTALYNANVSNAPEQPRQPFSFSKDSNLSTAVPEAGPSLISEARTLESLPTTRINAIEPVSNDWEPNPPETELAQEDQAEFEQTPYQPSSPRHRDCEERPEPRNVDLVLVKDEPLDDDDPLLWNTLDDSLDELNVELNLNRRVMLPISVRLPKGAKGSAFENPICVDDEEDELGGWDLDGWS
ncbi:hypothetical protein HD553DRAFT_302411 [Filobasidium floriforme]|uniref:uncharacterized protein n=1 Tax=Filobasidium floriforme TaxID=5210 RepID=UPI001E8D8F3B|nr:uncharacterized protein HD553DRAFT_302411 [Filobasidium floriforme]KAH8090430.1 hypothetical protein HD553DRAFT_302411 [Filobasidium floriforme]